MSLAVPELVTDRLVLRGFAERDLSWLAAIYGDPVTAEFLGGRQAPAEVWRRMASWIGHWTLRGFGPFAIEHRQSGEGIGFCALWSPPEFPEIEIGWGLLRRHHGQGFAAEAARRVRAEARARFGLGALVSYIKAANLPSRRLAERIGARADGNHDFGDWQAIVYRHPVADD
ncbi:MAG: GNAT family N-acetyltransferase [Hyphomicrobiaceae bacterium]